MKKIIEEAEAWDEAIQFLKEIGAAEDVKNLTQHRESLDDELRKEHYEQGRRFCFHDSGTEE